MSSVNLSDPSSINSKDMFRRKYNSCTELKSLLSPLPSKPGVPGYSFSSRSEASTRRSRSHTDLLKGSALSPIKDVSDSSSGDSDGESENVIRIYFRSPPADKREGRPLLVTHINLGEATSNDLHRTRYKSLDSWRIKIHQTVKCTYMTNDQNRIMNGTSRLFVNKDELIYRAGVYEQREETPPFRPGTLKERSCSTIFF
eukprot:TRINITY_DN7035_c0_g1_i1.p1 TRINITY_DN7035_c0_g1~~TRINITY_DN7035_c0_g1_i1.p1  ORF type:complete len:200 (-),score=41.58 TRINITY_DN7035_c0_g1_i1:128-727(-)